MDTFKAFVDRWSAPSVVISLFLIVVGGIVWGVQINSILVKLVENDTRTQGRLEVIEEYGENDRVNMAKVTLILDNLVAEVRDNKRMIVEHNRDAEEWKRRILLNEQRNQGPGP